MFAQIRKHQKTLWIFISGAVIISFVWYFNPNQRWSRRGGGGGGGGDDRVGMINGEPIHRAEYFDAQREATLNFIVRGGRSRLNDPQAKMEIDRDTRNRILFAHKLKDLNIEVSDQAVVDWITLQFQDPETKQYHYEAYQRFMQELQKTYGIKEVDFQRYARHQVGVEHLFTTVAASGKMVTPQEAEKAYRDEHEKVDVKLALFSLSNYVANVQVTDDAVAKFYTNRQAIYRVPERMQLSYVEFPSTNFLAKADERLAAETNLTQQIDAMYLQRGPSSFTDPSGQPLTPEAAKAKIREDLRKQFALNEARKSAFDFANQLADMPAKTNSPNPAENLESLATTKGLKAEVTEPFTQMQGPRNLGLPEQFTRTAFRLTPEEPLVTEPVQGDDAFYIVCFKQKLASELPALDTIRDRVVQDYKSFEANSLTRQAANSFLAAVTNSPAKSDEFAKLGAQNGISLIDLPPFSKDSRSPIEGLPWQVNASSLRNVAFELGEGQTSSYIPASNGGYVIYVEKVLPASDDDVKRELADFTKDLQRQKEMEAFNEWFAHEAQLAKLQLPGDKSMIAAQEE
jgi:hypothetical protein